MRNEEPNILSINLGSRYIGFALFVNTELRIWQVKTLQYSALEKKVNVATEIIFQLLNVHDANAVIIKKLHPSRTSKQLFKLITKIKDLIQHKGYELHEYSLSDIKQSLFPERKSNKEALMQEMVRQYPILQRAFQKEQINKNKYFIRMFEAVALGAVHIQQIQK